MKSHTNILQSKKLAEILPIGSNDMFYEPSAGFNTQPSEVRLGNIKYAHPLSIPCWSLIALLATIPIEHSLHGYLTENGMVYRVETLYAGNSKNYDNPVDACVNMIEKLNEQKLI